MKKLSAFIILIFAAIFTVSCGFADEDEDFTDTENSSADSNSDDSSNQENTQENNTGDTGSDSNQDSDPSDTTDSDSDSNNDQGGDNGNGDDTDTGTNPGDNTGTGDNNSGTTVEEEEEEEDDYDYEKCTEITLDSKIEYNYWDLDFMMQGGTVYRAYYDPRTGSDPDKEDYLNFEFYNTGRYLTGSYDLAGKNYSSYSGLFLVVYEDGGAKNYIQRKGRVIVTSKEGASSSIIVKITDVFLKEVTIDKSTHATTVVTDGACLKINDTTVSE